MRSLVLEGKTWVQYENMRRENKKTHQALCRIIQEILRDPVTGIGRPERLKHKDAEFWSRRIDRKNRIVYRYDEDYVYVHGIGGHYDRT